MLGLFRPSPTARGGPKGRIRLRLEGLEYRDQPSDGGGISAPVPVLGETRSGQNQRPAILDFQCRPLGGGLYEITGRVADENPAGLVVTLGGTTSAAGRTVVTQADGTFTLTVRLRTDGTDDGYITATTVDREGLVSDPVSRWVDPSP